VEEVGSSEVGSSGKVRLSEKVVLVLIAIEAGAVKGGFWILAIKAGSRLCHQGGCCRVGFWVVLSRRVRILEADQRQHQPRFGYRSHSWPLCPAEPPRELVVLGLSVPHGQVRSGFALYLARSDLGSLHALQPGQVWVRFRALQVGLVSRSGGGTMPESGRAYHRWSSGVSRP
jgi:hypothetical protein